MRQPLRSQLLDFATIGDAGYRISFVKNPRVVGSIPTPATIFINGLLKHWSAGYVPGDRLVSASVRPLRAL